MITLARAFPYGKISRKSLSNTDTLLPHHKKQPICSWKRSEYPLQASTPCTWENRIPFFPTVHRTTGVRHTSILQLHKGMNNLGSPAIPIPACSVPNKDKLIHIHRGCLFEQSLAKPATASGSCRNVLESTKETPFFLFCLRRKRSLCASGNLDAPLLKNVKNPRAMLDACPHHRLQEGLLTACFHKRQDIFGNDIKKGQEYSSLYFVVCQSMRKYLHYFWCLSLQGSLQNFTFCSAVGLDLTVLFSASPGWSGQTFLELCSIIRWLSTLKMPVNI